MNTNYLNGKRILITGASGSVGSELFKILLTEQSYSPKEVIGIDNNESELFLIDHNYIDDKRTSFFLADIRDAQKINKVMNGIDVVFHAAAFKHVLLCERSPFEAVQTNIIGVQNIIKAAAENMVTKVILTSTDKAVNPTNVMGTSKLMGERLMTAASGNAFKKGTIFASTRFGNVLGSRGSVIPIFHKQIKNGGPVTLTDPIMTRFIMTIEQAARLVLNSAALARGGEVFITKMPIVKICDLAEVMIQELAPKYGLSPSDIDIENIGIKPGEKLYEELMSPEETRRAIELEDYFSVLPAFRGFYENVPYDYDRIVSTNVTNPYTSSKEVALDKDELRKFLVSNGLLEPSALEPNHPDHRYWPGDK